MLESSRIESLERLSLNRERVTQITGFLGLTTLALGAALYAINYRDSRVTGVLLLSGVVLSVAYGLLNMHAVIAFVTRRSSRYGANMLAIIILFACIAVIIQALSVRHSYRHDFTQNKRFSLAPQTLNILKGLQDDVEIYGFFKESDDKRAQAQSLFDQFAHESPRIHYELIDPDRKPTRAAEMKVTGYGVILVRYRNRDERTSEITEEALTNAILQATRDEKKEICFVTGHGEKDTASKEPSGYSTLRQALENENYSVTELSLFDTPNIPDECSLLVIAGPTHDYFESEIVKISDYLAKGRNALFMLDPRIDYPNIEGLLGSYRVVLDNDVVIDPYSRVFGTDYTVPAVTQYVDHPITRGMDVATFFPLARSVRISTDDIPGVTVQYLAQTGKSAWGETDLERVKQGQAVRSNDDTPGPVAIALIATRKYEGADTQDGEPVSKIVVFGDSDFASNSAFRISGNGDLFLNAVNYLAEEKDLVAIRAKQGLGNPLFLTASQGRLIFFVSVILLPLGVLGFGVSVFVRRRNQG